MYLLKFHIARIAILALFCSCDVDPMTFIHELDPISPQDVLADHTVNFLRHGF